MKKKEGKIETCQKFAKLNEEKGKEERVKKNRAEKAATNSSDNDNIRLGPVPLIILVFFMLSWLIVAKD